MAKKVMSERIGVNAPTDRSELRDLYAHYATELRGFIVGRFGYEPPDPEDVVQAVFAKLAHIENLDTIRNKRAFLYTSARNFIIDERRRSIKFSEYSKETRQLNSEVSFDPSPETVLLGKEAMEQIEKTIAGMPERQRQCLLLHRLNDLSFAEIGRRLGLSGYGVSKIVARAIVECDEALRAEAGSHEPGKQ